MKERWRKGLNICRMAHLFLRDAPLCGELLEERGPLPPEEVGAGERAVAPDRHQVGDPPLHQVLGRPQTTLPLPERRRNHHSLVLCIRRRKFVDAPSSPEVLAAGGPDDGAALVDDAGDVGPVRLADVLPAVHHALQPNELQIHDRLSRQFTSCLRSTIPCY